MPAPPRASPPEQNRSTVRLRALTRPDRRAGLRWVSRSRLVWLLPPPRSRVHPVTDSLPAGPSSSPSSPPARQPRGWRIPGEWRPRLWQAVRARVVLLPVVVYTGHRGPRDHRQRHPLFLRPDQRSLGCRQRQPPRAGVDPQPVVQANVLTIVGDHPLAPILRSLGTGVPALLTLLSSASWCSSPAAACSVPAKVPPPADTGLTGQGGRGRRSSGCSSSALWSCSSSTHPPCGSRT